jgi:ParB-like chromosome segregation protein Spo0J
VVDKRKSTGISDLLFEDVNPYGAVIGEPVSKPIERFPLESIRPDPKQPRRLLPIDLAKAVNEGDVAPAAAVREWTKRVEAETDSVLVKEIRELRRLAASIEQHGLINPITIYPAKLGENRYIIVTGERRYWAHVLLNLEGRQIQEGEEVQSSDQIKATLVPHGTSIRAHQLIENLMREDINVLEKAQGIIALRKELSDKNVAHGQHSEEKVKPVPWKEVDEALSMSRAYRTRLLKVLSLSEEAQGIVSHYDLTERTIRPITEKLIDLPNLQVVALKQLVAWKEEEAGGERTGRRIVPSVQVLVEKMLVSQATTSISVAQPHQLNLGKFRQKIRGTRRYIKNVDEELLEELTRIANNEASLDIVDELKALRDQIDEMLATLAEDKGTPNA